MACHIGDVYEAIGVCDWNGGPAWFKVAGDGFGGAGGNKRNCVGDCEVEREVFHVTLVIFELELCTKLTN